MTEITQTTASLSIEGYLKLLATMRIDTVTIQVSPLSPITTFVAMFVIEGSDSFDQIDNRRVRQALARSKLLSGQALGTENITQFEISAEMCWGWTMAYTRNMTWTCMMTRGGWMLAE